MASRDSSHPKKMVSRKEYRKLVDRFGLFIVLGLVGSFAVFVAIALFGGFSNVISTIGNANKWYYLLAFACVFASYIARFFKWDYLTRKLNLKIPKRKNFLVYLSTNAMSITPGNIGSVVAAYTIKKLTNNKFAKIIPIVTMNLFTDFVGFAIFAFLISLYIGKYVIYVIILDLVLVIPFIFILTPWIYNLIKQKKKKGYITKKVLKYGGTYYLSQSTLNKPRTYLFSLMYTMPADFLNSFALYFSLLAVGLNPRVIVSTFIFSVAQIFGMISTLPGGVGVADATLVTLLKSEFMLSSALSSAVTIMTRIAYLWFGVAIGLIALLWTLRYWKNSK
ncbi:MAG: lysylphosphatidylglycerol synthase transmembrane domain-containing protein [Candidatus Micrarchaeaceae archaeon]|jgi:glycosyltransferase 2 family protein